MAKLVLSKYIEANQDAEDAMAADNEVDNYKGVFFNDDTEQKYYEAGAHFSYKGLCKLLDAVIKTLSPSRRAKSIYLDEFQNDDNTKYKMVQMEKNNKTVIRKENEKVSRNLKVYSIIPNNSLNYNNLSFLKKLNCKDDSKTTLMINKNHQNETVDKKNNLNQNSKNNLILKSQQGIKSQKKIDFMNNNTLLKENEYNSTYNEKEVKAKSINNLNNFYYKKIDPIIEKAKIKVTSITTSAKKIFKDPKKNLNHLNDTSNLNEEKKEIFLNNKTKNSSIINLSNNVDQTTLSKSLNNANQSRVQNSSKNDMNSSNSIKFELKNFYKIESHNKNKDSEALKFITSSIDRIERLKHDNSKDVSPNNITSNTNIKTENDSPEINKKDCENKVLQALNQPCNQISFEAKENTSNNKIQEIFANIGNLNIQGKSRNQKNNFFKNNFFNSEKNPSLPSKTTQKNLKEKSNKQTGLPRSTFEIENKTVNDKLSNNKINSNLTMNDENGKPKKKDVRLNYNNVSNNLFLTKIENVTKINFRNHQSREKQTLTTSNLYSKIDVKKTKNAIFKQENKSNSKEKMIKMNQFRENKIKAVKLINQNTASEKKNNTYCLKKTEFLTKYKGNLIINAKLIEKNRKLSYGNKEKYF